MTEEDSRFHRGGTHERGSANGGGVADGGGGSNHREVGAEAGAVLGPPAVNTVNPWPPGPCQFHNQATPGPCHYGWARHHEGRRIAFCAAVILSCDRPLSGTMSRRLSARTPHAGCRAKLVAPRTPVCSHRSGRRSIGTQVPNPPLSCAGSFGARSLTCAGLVQVCDDPMKAGGNQRATS